VVAGFWRAGRHQPRAAGAQYTLEQANYLKAQLRLYVQVSDAAEAQVYKVTALGPLVSFSHPEAQVDRQSRLNVLWQTGAQAFSYAIVNPDGGWRCRIITTIFSRARACRWTTTAMSL